MTLTKVIMCISCALMVSCTPTKPKIIIVGAGPSGIAAGTKLYEKGFHDITILEAENRYGGRIHTIDFDGIVLDLGAQWCDGEQNNVVYEMAYPLGLLNHSVLNMSDPEFVDSAGREIPEKQNRRMQEMFAAILEDEEKIAKYNGSFGDYVDEQVTEKSQTEFNDTDPILRDMYKNTFEKYINAIHASDTWYNLSTTSYVEFHDSPGDAYMNWKREGFKTILHVLMKKIPDANQTIPLEEKMLFNKEVSVISMENDQVVVECKDGTRYNGAHVIVTVSLGVLKENIDTLFAAPLPPFKQNAVQGLAFGTLDNIILKFNTPWWPKKFNGFTFLWTKSDKANLADLFGGTQEENEWILDISGFITIDDEHNILQGFITGPSAIKMESLSEDIVRQKCSKLIRIFYGKKYQIPDADKIIRSRWYSNPHFRGSYSYRSLKTDALHGSAADLAKPILNTNGRPAILFAGEATNSHHFATVHGAIETGWREADRVADLYK